MWILGTSPWPATSLGPGAPPGRLGVAFSAEPRHTHASHRSLVGWSPDTLAHAMPRWIGAKSMVAGPQSVTQFFPANK